MAPLSRTNPRLAERGMLLLGLASAAVLAVAAFLPSTDPELAGKTALAQLAARTNGAVVAEWERMLRDPAPIATASSEVFRSDGRDPASFEVKSGEPAAETDDVACEALLAEARRSADDGDAKSAHELVEEALHKRPSTRQTLDAWLLRMQVAARDGSTTELRTGVEALFDDLNARATSDDANDRAVRLLIASSAALGELRTVPRAALHAWLGREIVHGGARIERMGEGSPWYAVVGRDRLLAYCERLRAVTFPTPFTTSSSRDELVEAAPDLAAVRTLDELSPEWPVRPGSNDWNVFAASSDLFARQGSELGPWSGFFVTARDLGAELERRLRAAELLPEGFEIDVRGDDASLGVALGSRVPLADDAFGYVLRHRDPDALVRGTQRKHALLRAALLAMSVLAATTGLLMARAQRKSRMLAELKSGFVANVSHELRTPVASILLMAENLEAGRAGDDASHARYHALIKREALRLARLVDDVLDFSRIERGKTLDVRRETIAARAAVDEWCDGARAWADSNAMELELAIGALPESVSVDRESIRRALLNLLDNARKHSGSKHVTLGARADRDALVLSVVDRGHGIPHARRAAIFEPFERGEQRDGSPGTGLGLAIVKEIVLAHGGTIAVVANENGRGSVFEIRLPQTSEDIA